MFSSLNIAEKSVGSCKSPGNAARWAPIPLCLIGYAKLVKGSDMFAGIVHAIGIRAPHLIEHILRAWLGSVYCACGLPLCLNRREP
jgi:hypothetical protein